MDIKIRKFKQSDMAEVLVMMTEFYSSDAVFTNGNPEIFNRDFDFCTQNSPYVEGFVFEHDGKTAGYAMIAKSFSTEFGKKCIWFEDLFLKPEFRGNGIIPKFIKYVENIYQDCIFRLEAEEENGHAVHVYEKCGFSRLPYIQLKK